MEELLNTELTAIKILNMYISKVKHNDSDKSKSILDQFLTSMTEFRDKIDSENMHKKGFYILPLHRTFAFFSTRLMVLNLLDDKVY